MGEAASCITKGVPRQVCRCSSRESQLEHKGSVDADVDFSDIVSPSIGTDVEKKKDKTDYQGAGSALLDSRSIATEIHDNKYVGNEGKTDDREVGSTLLNTKLTATAIHDRHDEDKSIAKQQQHDSEFSLSGSEATVCSHRSHDDDQFSDSDYDGMHKPTLDNNFRSKKKRKRMRLLITHTMGLEPSKSLQLVIENTNCKLEDHYDMGSVLGEGSYGVVRRAHLKVNGAARAVKSIKKELMKKKYYLLKDEIHIMKLLDHPNLLMLLEIFEDKKQLHLVLEFCAGGSLADYVDKKQRLSEEESAIVMQQVIRAALYLHSLTVCHRDFKADNCLLAESGPIVGTTVKVADFGISCCLRKGKFLTQICGTPTHMAPEVLRKKYKHDCDIWSCGVIAHYLLCGYVPFAGSSNEDIFHAVKNTEIEKVLCPSDWLDTSDEAFEFVRSLLTKNPRKRPTARKALEDVWIKHRVKQASNLPVPDTLVSNLRKFREGNKFKRAILQTIASMLPGGETSVPRKAFILLDLDGDGVFSVEELADALGKGVLKQSKDVKNELQLLNNSFVSTEHKAFTYSEFVAATFDKQKAHKQGLFKSAFQTLDKNDDHHLQISELATGHLLGKLSTDEVQEVLEQTLEIVDLDGDGTISYSEYLHMFSNFNLRASFSM